MTENTEEFWKDCNCMNCRLARIEDNIKELRAMLNNIPMDFGETSKQPQ
jgi:hypothetical protein